MRRAITPVPHTPPCRCVYAQRKNVRFYIYTEFCHTNLILAFIQPISSLLRLTSAHNIIPTALDIRTQYHASSRFFLHSTITWQGSESAACVWIVHELDESDVCWTVRHCDKWRIKNQLDVTYYFIVLLIGSTCFGHYYVHHQELATVILITTLVVSFLVCCMLEVRCGYAGVVYVLQSRHYSSLTESNLQHTANQERNDHCGNQYHSRELLMMDIVMPETCWAYKKYNKIISTI